MGAKKNLRVKTKTGNLIPETYPASEVYLIGVDMGVGIALAILDQWILGARALALSTKGFDFEQQLSNLKHIRKEIAECGRAGVK